MTEARSPRSIWKLLADFIDGIDYLLMVLAAITLVLMTSIVVFEIVVRALFSTSTLIADEMTSYFLAALSFLALGYTLRTGGHLQVTLITEHLPSAIRKWLDVAIVVIGLVATSAFTFWLVKFTAHTYQSKIDSQSQIETPLWIPQSTLCIGAFVLLLSLLSRLIRILRNETVA